MDLHQHLSCFIRVWYFHCRAKPSQSYTNNVSISLSLSPTLPLSLYLSLYLSVFGLGLFSTLLLTLCIRSFPPTNIAGTDRYNVLIHFSVISFIHLVSATYNKTHLTDFRCFADEPGFPHTSQNDFKLSLLYGPLYLHPSLCSHYTA